MHLLMAVNALAAYQDHNKRFDMYTDASDFQLGACVTQEGRLVAYFSQKLTKISAKLYNNGKGNAFHHCNSRRILNYAPWCRHSCFTDHQNLMFDTLKTQHVLRWCTKIEEFSPILHNIEGPCNILANNLSRLHCLVTPAQIAKGKKLIEPAEVSIEEQDKVYFLDQEYSGLYDEDI